MGKEVRLPPEGESNFSQPASISHVARSPDGQTWLVQDVRNGVIWAYEKASGVPDLVLNSHSGAVTGALVFSNFPGLVVSSGLDGTLRAHNMTAHAGANELYKEDARADIGITCMTPSPEVIDVEKRSLICGYTDGTIRAYCVCRDGFVLVQAQKPHNVPVRQIEYSEDGQLLASLAVDNSIFIFEVRELDDHLTPLGFVELPVQVNHMTWHSETSNILLSLDNGTLLELVRPESDVIDNSETFKTQLDYRILSLELPEVVEEEEEDEEGEEGEEGEGGEGEGVADPESPGGQ